MAGISHDNTQEETQTLGAFLRTRREQKGASIEDVNQSTKISIPILKAIEEDDNERLPAAAFCRGFYSLYADYLELDPKDILERLSQTKGNIGKSSNKLSKPPILKSQNITNYAESPFLSPATGKGFLSLICLAIIIGLCWYFNWNPVDFIGNKLRPQIQNQLLHKLPEVAESEEIVIEEEVKNIVSADTMPLAAPSTAAETSEQSQTDITAEPQTMEPYSLEIDFYTSGTLKVTLDDGFVLDKHFTAGKTLQWQVKKKIILDMPEAIQGNLRLNGIEIPLPDAENGRRRLSLPEDLLD
jgi:cytoskeletal protein RodZ